MAIPKVRSLDDSLVADSWAQVVKITKSGWDFTGYELSLTFTKGGVAAAVTPTLTSALAEGNPAEIDLTMSLTAGQTTTLGAGTYAGNLRLTQAALGSFLILRFTLKLVAP